MIAAADTPAEASFARARCPACGRTYDAATAPAMCAASAGFAPLVPARPAGAR